ncbi:hypothetical protein BDP27DRAFT_1424436 [Rhodocollybia butyracea]|uniref:Uncharacterized protein n=1 Tax=Rhodocollybia butyracea TaxID=206335 RepID=A0A9P5PPL3_9AGAR|nr:hypothetical protein BDP27DRAFT_1424436 [Rhodocollybia butyracea]
MSNYVSVQRPMSAFSMFSLFLAYICGEIAYQVLDQVAMIEAYANTPLPRHHIRSQIPSSSRRQWVSADSSSSNPLSLLERMCLKCDACDELNSSVLRPNNLVSDEFSSTPPPICGRDSFLRLFDKPASLQIHMYTSPGSKQSFRLYHPPDSKLDSLTKRNPSFLGSGYVTGQGILHPTLFLPHSINRGLRYNLRFTRPWSILSLNVSPATRHARGHESTPSKPRFLIILPPSRTLSLNFLYCLRVFTMEFRDRLKEEAGDVYDSLNDIERSGMMVVVSWCGTE